MAFRASETFHSYLGAARLHRRDSVVPEDIAKRYPDLCYDDGGPTPKPVKASARKRPAPKAEA